MLGIRHRLLSGRQTAFTLVELLVVMFILAVLIAIIVSVAGYVTRAANEKETSAIQAVVMDAVQAWRDNNTNDPKTYPPDNYIPPITPGDVSGRALINFLTGKIDWNGNGSLTDTNDADNSASPSAKVAMDILLKLPKEAWNGNWNDPVRDSWGREMRYDQTGGLGGRPVVISAGPDGRFGTDDLGFGDDPARAEDNIRSDEHQ